MQMPAGITIYGDQTFRGQCPTEAAEQVTFFNFLRRQYPDRYGIIALHPRNEGKRTRKQVMWQKAEGLATGAPDIIIPGRRTFLCELKRRDHTKSKISNPQITYLETAQSLGAFVCIALGYDAALEAFNEWSRNVSLGR